MCSVPDESYPRPDFWRPTLAWKSLNGPWDFLFDDEDIGLTSLWHQTSLPTQTSVQSSSSSNDASGFRSQTITSKIAANAENLIKGNLSEQKRDAAVNKKQKIEVPYVFQSPASGINERSVHEVLWYERVIQDVRTEGEKRHGYRLLVRFGAVDYEAKVWVNGEYVGGHRGGHVPFDLDITDAISKEDEKKEHRITLRVYDSAYDLTQPRGKQYWGAKPESIFYTPSGGVWQSVWLESVPPVRIADSSNGTILRSNDIESGLLHASIAVQGRRAGHGYCVEIEASLNGVVVSQSERKGLRRESDMVDLDVDLRLSNHQVSHISGGLAEPDNKQAWLNNLALWSPSYPHLYDLTIRLFASTGTTHTLLDIVRATTGMRSLNWTTGDGTFLLNKTPLFQALCLDQGYWPSTLLTPPSPASQSCKNDILLAKKMGFNGCRKHQKVEDPLFLYWADKLGYLVWGEMANAYEFSREYCERFDDEWMQAVKRDINHPCIVTWTPVNESWGYTDLQNNVGQRNHIRSLYYMTKTLDPTRPINDNCGWEHVKTDLTTFHDYADSPALAETCKTLAGIISPKSNRPVFLPPIPGLDASSAHQKGTVVLCTEFGGVNIAPAEAKSDPNDRTGEWGYTTAADPKDLLKRVEKLVNAVVDGGHCAGFVWTQFTDIEQETNGLYSFDRKEKLDAERVKEVMENAAKKYYERLERES